MMVRDTLREAVDAGAFVPGQRMPSTKGISQQMRVSLVTAHRALQQLVADGILERRPGRGTFVCQGYTRSAAPRIVARIAMVLGARSSLLDSHVSQIVDAIRDGAAQRGVELSLQTIGEDVGGSIDALLTIGASREQVQMLMHHSGSRAIVAIDDEGDVPGVSSVRCDDLAIGRLAVEYLRDKGHQAIGFVGAEDTPGATRARWDGFFAAHQDLSLPLRHHHTLRSLSWRLDEPEQMALVRMLCGSDRPTAIFAAGFSFAISVYHAAGMAGLSIPDDLSVIGVDDTPCAPFLSPPLTTFRQPLTQLGQQGLDLLLEMLRRGGSTAAFRVLKSELIERRSVAGPLWRK
jgi:DNA-binding LacI/PurR family transcriptional regulator